MVMSRLFTEHPAAWLESVIGDFINHSKENNLQNQRNDPAFESPLVGFASGADPLWESYKEYVGPFHWTPLEIFERTFPGSGVVAQDLTVISWVLPQTALTKADNRKETFYPAERWARARIFGEEVNAKLREHMTQVLQQEGYKALAPQLSPEWSRQDSPRYVYASTWSERHAAYAAGLGTFGLCDGLITSVGKAVRVGSVIANIQISPTSRPYTDHRAYCLFYTGGICGKCIPRCPVGALSENGHDKKKCRGHIRPVTEDYVKANFGFDGYGCGLCQTGVPCESKVPTKRDVS